jgi:hypothetical protein
MAILVILVNQVLLLTLVILKKEQHTEDIPDRQDPQGQAIPAQQGLQVSPETPIMDTPVSQAQLDPIASLHILRE